MWKLIIAFTALPAVELYLLLQLGSAFGVLPTVGLILFTGITGGVLAKREGLAVLGQLTASLRRGLPPASQLVEGGLVVAGGLLLITPGIVTDLAGFALILRPSRRWLAPHVLRWIAARVSFNGAIGDNPSARRPHRRPSPAAGAPTARPRADLFDHPTP